MHLIITIYKTTKYKRILDILKDSQLSDIIENKDLFFFHLPKGGRIERIVDLELYMSEDIELYM